MLVHWYLRSSLSTPTKELSLGSRVSKAWDVDVIYSAEYIEVRKLPTYGTAIGINHSDGIDLTAGGKYMPPHGL